MKTLLRNAAYTLANRLRLVSENAERARLIKSFRSCGKNPTIFMPIVISEPENVEIGDDVSLAPFVHIWGGGGIKIGHRVMIASHTAITSLTHDYCHMRMYGTIIKKAIVIEDDVWIGGHCVVLPGIIIGKGSVIGAGSIVTRNVEPNAIMAGVPARLLKYRSEDSEPAITQPAHKVT